jgi:pimeloyl-ACP methyl ester carboxylesterase
MKNTLCLISVILSLVSFVCNLQAEVLFEEDWDMSFVDPAKWDREGPDPGGPFLFDLGSGGTGGSGDYGLYIHDGSYSYAMGLRTKESFSRVPGKLLRCTFTLFRDHSGVPAAWEGPSGPWVDTDILSGEAYPILRQIEAGVSRYEVNSGNTKYVEGSPSDFSGIALSPEFTAAFNNATHKNDALVVRVSLGPTTGAMIEWTPYANVFADPNFDDFTIEYNTIGETGGAAPSYGSTNMVSSADPLWVFFGGAGDGVNSARAIVDDIVVETVDIPCLYTIEGDFNGDCKVNIADLKLMVDNWLVDCKAKPYSPECEGSATGIVTQFQEDFESQDLDLSKWNYSNAGGEMLTVVEAPAGSGNWAARGTTSTYLCQTAIIAKQEFERDDDLLCEFRWWYEMGGADSIDLTSINGPWRQTPISDWDSYSYPIAEDLEAGFGEFIRRDYGTENHHWAEGNADWEAGLEFDTSFQNAVIDANSYENSILLRVRLGTSAGAKCYYSTDNGVYWNEVYMADGTPIDTTGMMAGTVYSPGGGGGGSVTVSGNQTVYLGFGVRGPTLQYWDDISVKSYAGAAPPDIPPDPNDLEIIQGLPQQQYYWTATYPNGTVNQITLDVLDDTAYTVGYVIEPTGTVDSQRRWVWVVPLWLALNSEYGNTLARYYVEEALDQGFHVVGIDVGTSCGSPKGAQVFQEFYEYLVDANSYDLQAEGARIIGVSNGGLITYGWAFRNPQYVDRIFGIYPAVDFTTWPGLSNVITYPPAGVSYNLTLQELTDNITDYNPIDNLLPLANSNVPIYHIHGDADTVVPMQENSVEAKSRYDSMGGQFDLEVFPGAGHGGMEFFQHEPGRDFILAP